MIETDAPPKVRVRLLVWGLTEGHAETAVQAAQRGRFRIGWEFAHVDRVTMGACPIDPTDPSVIAADCLAGWAYAVYPDGGAQ